MAKPQVTLTFAGDSTQLEKSFDRVGASSKGMSDDVGRSSKSLRDTGQSFDRVGEAADNVDTKAMGFRDTMTGVEDTSRGLSQIMKGQLFDGFLLLGMGVGDLASGMFNFLIPSIKAASTGMITNAVSTTKATVAGGAHRIATLGQAAATRVLTVAQRGLNLAMRANPIGIIITVLFALGAALVVAWRRSETFRRVVTAVWTSIKEGARAMGRVITSVARAIVAPFRAAFNAIRNIWNSILGGRGFTINLPFGLPDLSVRIPTLHTGGVMPGAPGTQGLALLQAGERVSPVGARGGTEIIQLVVDGRVLAEVVRDRFADLNRRAGVR